MNRNLVKLTLVALIVLVLVSLLIDFRIATGLILGFAFSAIYMRLLITDVDILIRSATTRKSKISVTLFLRYALMAAPLLLSLKFDEIFNVFGTFIGFLLLKIVMFVKSFVVKG